MKEHKVIGLMSGTSLDGLDIVAATFRKEDNWNYTIHASETISYSSDWKNKLSRANKFSAEEYALLDLDLGMYFGECVKSFMLEHDFTPDLIGSHGHTVFHQPHKKLTTQIGEPSAICIKTNTKVVADFRTLDVLKNGQGAPLVPIGDLLLFSEHKACINLGGIANISLKTSQSIQAFDVCVCNMLLNDLSKRINKPFDDGGNVAATGTIISELFEELNAIPFLALPSPKSIGKEWYDAEIAPIIKHYAESSTEDLLRTAVEHIATQLCKKLPTDGEILITGGGARNDFLIDRLRRLSTAKIEVPSDELVDFKEALIFGFLGLLKVQGKTNILKEVTGAESNSSSGVIYVP